MDTTAWKKQASLIVFCIVFIGCLSEVSIAKEEAVKLDDVFLMDIVTPILGIETVGGVMTNLIPKNTFIPAKKSHVFTTYQDQQTTVSIKVYEGRHNLTKDCKLLGTFDLSGIQPAPRGTPEIEVTFELVAHDILHVKAEDKASGKSEYITIKNIGSLSNEEIDRMIRQAEEFAEEDRRAGEGIDVIYTLKTYIYKIRNQIKDILANKLAQIKDKLANKLETNEKEEIENATRVALRYL